MIRKKSYNGLLTLGICSIILGLTLLIYSITSYTEIKLITDKIDFDSLDHNNQISTNERYYKYSEIYDTLNQKLEKNKNLLIKNMSCAYLDYAQHNIQSMYKLVYKNSNEDMSRQIAVKKDINELIDIYKNYNTCRKTTSYTDELLKMLEEIEISDNNDYIEKMDIFTNINQNNNLEANDKIKDEIFPQHEHEIIKLDTDIVPVTQKQTDNSKTIKENQYKKVQQYIESDGDKDTGRVFYDDAQ